MFQGLALSEEKKKQRLNSHTEQKDTQKTYAYKKPGTVSTSVMQKSKHDSWMMGVNWAVKLHRVMVNMTRWVFLPYHWHICVEKATIYSDNMLTVISTLHLTEGWTFMRAVAICLGKAWQPNTLLLLGSRNTGFMTLLIKAVVILFSYAKREDWYSTNLY